MFFLLLMPSDFSFCLFHQMSSPSSCSRCEVVIPGIMFIGFDLACFRLCFCALCLGSLEHPFFRGFLVNVL